MPAPPDSTKSSLICRLRAHATSHWPQLDVCTSASAARSPTSTANSTTTRPSSCVAALRRLRQHLGLRLYLYSSEKYEDQTLPTGRFPGTPEEALDCACGLYLAGPAT